MSARDVHDIVDGTALREAMGLPPAPVLSPAPTFAMFDEQEQACQTAAGQEMQEGSSEAVLGQPTSSRASESLEEKVVRLEQELALAQQTGRGIASHLQSEINRLVEGLGLVSNQVHGMIRKTESRILKEISAMYDAWDVSVSRFVS